MRKIFFTKQNAFTLIEVLVAMLVLAIGLLGLAAMTVVVLRSNVLSQQISEATTITSDLMETLKREPFVSLKDCQTEGNIVSFSAGTCLIIEDSGVGTNESIYPAEGSQETECAIPGIAEQFSGNDMTWDRVTANLVSAPASSATFCTAFNSLPQNQYVRYYRTYDPDPNDGKTEYRIVTVVLWKDRFHKWRRINLVTTRVN